MLAMTGYRCDTGCDANACRFGLTHFVGDGVDLPSARSSGVEEGPNVAHNEEDLPE